MTKVALMEESKKKVSVFVHALDPDVSVTGVVSFIYKLEIDVNKYLNPCADYKFEKTPSCSIKPIFRFSCKDNMYPEGMSCVLLGSKLYFMGGCIGYVTQMLGLEDYDDDLRYGSFSFDPLTAFVENKLDYYPCMVSVFDCDTCTLMPEDYMPSMLSGKYRNPITFVANGQIFVLSTKIKAPGMVAFETIQPHEWMGWKQLEEPPKALFDCSLFGSALVKGKFLVTSQGWNFYMFSYDITSGNWAAHSFSRYIPQMYRHSVLVGDTFYSPVYKTRNENDFPVVSFGPLDSTLLHQDGIDVDSVVLDCLKKYKFSSPNDAISLPDWPVYVNQFGHTSRCLFHLGGLLKGTDTMSTCFGFVEPLISRTSDDGSEFNAQCELRFVAFEAHKSTGVCAAIRATTIDACQLYMSGIYQISGAFAYLA